MPSNTPSTTSNPEASRVTPGTSSTSTVRPPASSSIPPEDNEPADEQVKVFDDEDEREENVNEKYHQVDILHAIKSSLVTENEQVRIYFG